MKKKMITALTLVLGLCLTADFALASAGGGNRASGSSYKKSRSDRKARLKKAAERRAKRATASSIAEELEAYKKAQREFAIAKKKLAKAKKALEAAKARTQ